MPGKQRFQARVGEIPWGCARKGSFSGTRGQFHMGLCPERFVFKHEGSVSYRVVPGKVRFQTRGISLYGAVSEKQRFQARLGEIP